MSYDENASKSLSRTKRILSRNLVYRGDGDATPRSQEVLVKARKCRAPSKRALHSPCESRQIAAFGLNRMDISQCKRDYPLPPGASEILGVKFSGHIAALGPNMSANCQWAIGLTSGVSRRQQKAGRPTD
jgi:hypothetical protein